jgi:tetratricopeptide (TPR) repeat protein
VKVFLSADQRRVGKQFDVLCERMRAEGIEPVTAPEPAPGSSWQEALRARLADADAMVFLVDPAAKESRWLEGEWSAAVEHSWATPDKPMIPVLIGDAEAPPFLRDRMALRVPSSDELGEVAAPLVSALQQGSAVDSPEAQAGTEAKVRAEQQTRLSEISEGAGRLDAHGDPKERVVALQAQLEAARASGSDGAAITELEMRLADALRADGRHEEAVGYLEAAAARLSASPDLRRQLARVELNLARSLEKLERGAQALTHWRRGLTLYEQIDGRDSLMVSVVHMSLASLFDRLGDTLQARKHRDAAAAIARGQLERVGGWLTKLPVVGGLFDRFLHAKSRGGGEQTKGGEKE